MSIHAEVDLLRKVPLFASIDTAKLKLLAFTSERLTFPAGATLFHEGYLAAGSLGRVFAN